MTVHDAWQSAVSWPDGTARGYGNGPHYVVELVGAVDADAEELVATVLEAATRAGGASGGVVVVDPARVRFAGSAALRLPLRARAAGDLRIAGPLTRQVRLLFDVTDLSGSFVFYPDLDHALAE